jgi:site-specific recombinase XerD
VLRVFKRSSDSPANQEVVLPDALRTKLDRLFRWKRSVGECLDRDAPVFISRRGNRLSARQLREVFHVWQERAGFERRLNFHALRHTACSNLYRRTKDIRVTQRFARHKSILTTSIYAHPSDEDLVRAVLDLPC